MSIEKPWSELRDVLIHDLNNGLAVVEGCAFALPEFDCIDRETQEDLQIGVAMIKALCRKLALLGPERRAACERFRLADLLGETVGESRFANDCRWEADHELEVDADRSALMDALDELIRLAFDSGAERVKIDVHETPDEVSVAVTGTDADRDRCLESGPRAAFSLALATSVASQHGGQLDVKTNCMTLILPQKAKRIHPGDHR